MKIRTLVFAAAIGLGPAALLVPQAMAQPQWDIVHVNLPYSVSLDKNTLAPGDYTIQQLHSEGSTILLFYNGKGMKFETSAMTIPALGNTDNTPEKTTVSLHHIGDDYYFDKIFIQGKDYGYQFPLPAAAKAREREMTAVSVPASATVTSTATDATNTTTSDATATDTTAATTTNNDATAQTTPPPTVDTTPPPPPVPEVTQPTPPPPPEPQATTDTTPVPATSMDSSANREKRTDTNDTPMPATSAGWLAMLLSGGTLSSAGLLLRRKR